MNTDDLGRHGRFAAVDGWVYKRPCRTRAMTFCFVYSKSSIFVPDAKKCPSSWLIHLRYETKNSLKNKEKRLDLIGRLKNMGDFSVLKKSIMVRKFVRKRKEELFF